VKAIPNKETRRLLLQELRKATCLQTSLWDTCGDVIDEILDGESDAVSRVVQFTPEYAGKRLTERDLDPILAGFEEMNLAVPIGQGKKMRAVENLDPGTRRTLLKAFQKTISMQSDLWVTASLLAEVLDCTLEYVENHIRACAITADTGMELGEMDLHALLGEPEAEGYIGIGGPVKPIFFN
jgi:hypothetical protein